MIYLALGDSISIDDYTGVAGGGAVSQFASLTGADEVRDLTRDGSTTTAVLASLDAVTVRPDVVTLTAGGNDLLQLAYEAGRHGCPMPPQARASAAGAIVSNLSRITEHLAGYGCPVILNTVYDPTDGQDALAERLGVPASWRALYNGVNDGIRALAQERGFLLADLEMLFHGHGMAASNPWLVMEIEPNLAGATAIAREWHRLHRQVDADKQS